MSPTAGGSRQAGYSESDTAMLKKQAGYQVDGKWFTTRAEAAEYDAKIQLGSLVSGGEPAQDLVQWLIDNRERIVAILAAVGKTRAPRKANAKQGVVLETVADQEAA